MHHVYSTLANSNEYVRYSDHGPKGINVAEASVLINGGSGINRKNVQTPIGVRTAVSDEDMAWLKEHYAFKQHMKNGYITVRESEVHAEVAAAEMVTHDPKTDACPIIPQDFADDGKKESVKPVVNKKSRAA